MDVQPSLLNLSAFINQNLDKDLPLFTLAKRAGLSPFHFHRKFGAYFGESLHQHIKRLRLESAAYALRYGSQPVWEIARDAGYKTVSAFSHAFSGFAGEPPTRYRARGVGSDTPDANPIPAVELKPAWIGELEPQGFAFLRAEGVGRGQQPSVGDAIDSVLEIIGTPVEPPRMNGAATTSASTERQVDASIDEDERAVEIIAATSDAYGVAESGNFRIDVGVDADRVPRERLEDLGEQILPGGRYARFDFFCSSNELLDRCYRASMHALRGLSGTARSSLYFVRFLTSPQSEHRPDGARSYRFFMPLAA